MNDSSADMRASSDDLFDFASPSTSGGAQMRAVHIHQNNFSLPDKSNSGRSNHDYHLYYEIASAITSMVELPEDHRMHLPDDIAEKAQEVLNLIRDNTWATAPKIINESNEALIFTWRNGDSKAYLSVDDEDVSLLELDEQLNGQTTHLCRADSLDVGNLLESLYWAEKSESL